MARTKPVTKRSSTRTTTKATSKAASPKGTSRRSSSVKQPSMEALKNFVRTRGAEYMKDPNISSVGIGYKRTGGERTTQIAVQFTVSEKAVPEALAALNTVTIPESFEIDNVSVPTDVIQRDFKPEYRLVTEAAGEHAEEAPRSSPTRGQCRAHEGNSRDGRMHRLR
jgi:endonuclease G, mitochondrial